MLKKLKIKLKIRVLNWQWRLLIKMQKSSNDPHEISEFIAEQHSINSQINKLEEQLDEIS